jgi:hypothetical protein
VDAVVAVALDRRAAARRLDAATRGGRAADRRR